MDDLQLLVNWRDGDQSAGQELFSRHVDTLYRFFRNKASSGIDDLVQQTLLACVESHTQFQQRSSFRSFMLGVARYQLFDYYRRTKSDAARLEFNTVTVHALGLSPSSHLAKASEERLLLEALRRLPVNLQTTLELAYWEELTGPELAEVLDIPVDTAYSRLRRAKQLLKEQLAALAASREQLEATQTNLEQWARFVRDRLSSAEREPSPAA